MEIFYLIPLVPSNPISPIAFITLTSKKATSQISLRGCLLLRQSKMAFNDIRALPLMAFAVCDCLIAGAENCHLLSFSEQSERLPFFVIQCHQKKKSERNSLLILHS